MTRLLASVTNADEAQAALEGGADIIDLKNPLQGALGALPLADIGKIVALMDGRRIISATVGDLPMEPSLLASAVKETAATGVDIVKIGLFGTQDHKACIEAMRPLAAAGIKIVAVLFADMTPDFSLLPRLAATGFHGVMLDTAVKDGQRLTSWLGPEALRLFVEQGRALRLLSGLAGSLAIDDVPALKVLAPDYLGFRGALCLGSKRTATLDVQRLQDVRKVLYSCNSDVLMAV